MTIGDILKKYRTENKISQSEFAKISGISKGYISMLENNTNARDGKPITPTLEMVQKISRGMNISLNELLEKIGGKQKVSLVSNKKETDKRLQEIIECYNQMPEKGRELLLDQAQYYRDKHL